MFIPLPMPCSFGKHVLIHVDDGSFLWVPTVTEECWQNHMLIPPHYHPDLGAPHGQGHTVGQPRASVDTRGGNCQCQVDLGLA